MGKRELTWFVDRLILNVVSVMERRILHIDMDAFFAAVEQARNPALRGKPVIVDGEKGDARGVVCTASYEARPFGVRSAMPLAEARRLCPHGIFMRGDFAAYREASLKVRAVLDTVSPLVEIASIDEAYIDVSGSQRLFGGDDEIAGQIKEGILAETGLTCTIAISPNKLVSKVASDEAKPDGYIRIGAGAEAAFLRPLAIRKLRGVGPRTCEVLESLGITTIGGLADMPESKLIALFGPAGYGLRRAARGISTSEVVPESVPKSISRETTFEKDLLDWPHLERILTYLTEKAAFSLREHGMESRRVTLKVRYSDFHTSTFAQTLAQPTCLDCHILQALESLIPKAKSRRDPVRLIGVALTVLSFGQHQLGLFDPAGEKWERALASVDALRQRHGFEMVRLGKSVGPMANRSKDR